MMTACGEPSTSASLATSASFSTFSRPASA